MNPRFRPIYLFLGFAGLIYLLYHFIITFEEGFNPGIILLISVPDLVVFFLAYKTYPVECDGNSSR
ncbi:MAG TPA: hypothetical protein VIM16_04235 [Mucilaginibacter sp.]|jgi:hypothetical protein